MKKITGNVVHTFCIVLCTFYMVHSSAQAPQGVNYQAVARNAAGNPLATQAVTVDFKIYKTNPPPGTFVYSETHNTNTNQFGLFTLIIGSLNPALFSTIKWGTDIHYLEVIVNGNNMGWTQFMTVPYAFYADSAGKAPGTLPAGSNGQTLRYDGGANMWTVNSNLFNNGTNVGIGTSGILGDKLVVAGGGIGGITLRDQTDMIDAINLSAGSGASASGSISLKNTGVTTVSLSGIGTSYFNAGSIGIGTNAPQSLLHLLTIGNSLEQRLQGTASPGLSLGIGFYDGATERARLNYSQPHLQFINKVASGHLQFFTNNLPRMTIDEAGEVGIGTTSPIATLHLAGRFILNHTNTTLNSYIELPSNSGVNLSIQTGGLAFAQFKDNRVVALGIQPSDNVGIGTTTPVSKLQVAGDVGLGDGDPMNNEPVVVYLYNNTGMAVSKGDIVIAGGGPNSFMLIGSANHASAIGVVYDAIIAPNAAGRIAIAGVAKVKADVITTVGDHVLTSFTPGRASSVMNPFGPDVAGSIGIWLESVPAGILGRALLR